MNSYHSPDTPWEIREQILKYESTRLMSDLERARFFGLSEGCRMRENAKIVSPTQLTIGRHCYIGEGVILDASAGLWIGDHTTIAAGVFVWTHDSFRLNIKGHNTREYSKDIRRKPTKIGSRCFIGGPSVILAGVTIGDGCVIPAMSVVSKDVPDRTLYRSPAETSILERLSALEKRIKRNEYYSQH